MFSFHRRNENVRRLVCDKSFSTGSVLCVHDPEEKAMPQAKMRAFSSAPVVADITHYTVSPTHSN